MRPTPTQKLLRFVPPAVLAAALLWAGAGRVVLLQQGRDGYAGKQILLNEICAKNTTIAIQDAAGQPLSSDWVELYNPTATDYDLGGCYLSDRANEPTQYQFPTGTTLPAGGYLVLPADGVTDPENTALHLNFMLNGEGDTLRLYAPDGRTVLDELTYPALAYDVTYGRRAQDGAGSGLFACATPGAANPADFWQREVATAELGTVKFSQQGGFYTDNVPLALSCDDPDAIILYTLDGSEPDMRSNFYTTPLTLTDRSALPNRYVSQPSTLDAGYWLKNYAAAYAPDPVAKATTVTARLYKNGTLGQSVSAQTYWVGQSGYSLPIVSITANAADLFGANGIYLPGQTYFTLRKFGTTGLMGNYSAGQSVSARVQLFGADGSSQLQTTGMVKVTGGVSRATETLKNLQLRLDTTTDILPAAQGLSSFTLRGAGASSVHFSLHKDAFWNNYLYGTAPGASLGVRQNLPAVLFLQDEYWGVYTLRERMAGDYFAAHFGLDKRQVLFPEQDDPNGEAAMLALAMELDALPAGSDQAYSWAAAHFDLENYSDWLIAQMFTHNLDGLYSGGNNTVLWRCTDAAQGTGGAYTDGRWRFVLNDLDATMFEVDADPLTPLLEADYSPAGGLASPLNWYCVGGNLFQKLWDHAQFRAEFTARLTDALATTYAPERLLPAFDAWCDILRPELAQDLPRQQVIPNALAPLADALTDSPTPEVQPTAEEWEQNAAAVRKYLAERGAVLAAALAG